MKILFLDQFSDLGGAQQCLLDLLPAIQEQGWEAIVAVPGEGRLFAEAERLGAKTQRLRSGPYRSGSKSVADICRFGLELPRLAHSISAIPADVLYVNGPRLLPAASRAAGQRIPLIFHAHSYLGKAYAARLARHALQRSRAVVIGSCHFVLQPLQACLENLETHVVPVAARAPGVQSQRSRGPKTRIGLIGRISPEKGQAEMLRAARLLADAEIEWVICGAPLMGADDYHAAVRRLAEGLRVEWMGWRDDVHEVLATLDLLVVPSAPGEATTRVIPEAFAAGVPVIATSSGGIPEIVQHGENGYLAGSATPEDLARAVREFLAKPEKEIARIIACGRATWERNHRLEAFRGAIVTVLSRIAERAGFRRANAPR
ncbi:MAG TPA: glycosyltransferase family 4 protein [Bryobacteraceae bacterium]|nr:glycosyltransferase family 4 protein [Bryobacteraceae bacterium]